MRRAIPGTRPGKVGRRKRLDDTIRHFENNLNRMIDRDLRWDDLEIGSGAGGGAVYNLVPIRLDGPWDALEPTAIRGGPAPTPHTAQRAVGGVQLVPGHTGPESPCRPSRFDHYALRQENFVDMSTSRASL